MILVIMGLAIVALIICVCVMWYTNRKLKQSCNELIHMAKNLSIDMTDMEQELKQIRDNVIALTDGLTETEDDLK